MSDFVSEAKRLLRAAARPLDVVQLGAMIADRSDISFPGRRPGVTLAARLRAAQGRDGGCFEVGPGVWAAPADEVRASGGAEASDDGDGTRGNAAAPDVAAWRADVLRLLDAMGYRGVESIREGAWRTKIGWGSAETNVFVQVDGRAGELPGEAVAEHRRSIVENSCLAGVLVCRGRAGDAALAEARRVGAVLVTIVDGAVIARAFQGRAKRRA